MSSDRIVGHDDGLVLVLAHLVKSRYNWRNKVGSKSPLVLSSSNQPREGGGLDIAPLVELIHVVLKLHEGRECLDIGGKARDAHQGEVIDLEDALEVAVNGAHLLTEASVSTDA